MPRREFPFFKIQKRREKSFDKKIHRKYHPEIIQNPLNWKCALWFLNCQARQRANVTFQTNISGTCWVVICYFDSNMWREKVQKSEENVESLMCKLSAEKNFIFHLTKKNSFSSIQPHTIKALIKETALFGQLLNSCTRADDENDF